MNQNNHANIENSVLAFHNKYGHFVTVAPTTNIPDSVKALRISLIQEEWKEMLEKGIIPENLEEIADGAADLIYVVVGTCISYGIPINRIFNEVHRSNMTKTAARVPLGEKYGTKTPKGPDFIPPDIKGILYNPEQKTRLEQLYGD